MKALFVLFISITYCYSIQGQSAIDSIFRNSYKVYELQRLPNGMYRDSKLFTGADYHPVSISNTGIGLISLCIADAMNWISDAPELALNTLKTINGNHPIFNPDRTSNGYFRHFMDVNTGEQMWNSEYSTIDTDILMSGALFAMKYFQDDSITHHTMTLWNSIDFEAAIDNPTTGKIYLSMNSDGTGVVNSLTTPYSEYMIVAWLAKNASDLSNSVGNELWNNYYASPDLLPTVTYKGVEVLSDNTSTFLSSFTHQFNYYFCNYFTNSADYIGFFENAQKADAAWWGSFNNNQYEWGLGAGSAITTPYQANAINNNVDTIISPHIIAGFIPVNLESKNDLVTLWNSNIGKYLLPSGDLILWRSSKNDIAWHPNEVIGIDYASLLFGVSTLPQYLGSTFFATNNDFFTDLSTSVTMPNKVNDNNMLYPNPCINFINVTGLHGFNNYTIYNTLGEEVQRGAIYNNGRINVQDLANNLYFIKFSTGSPIKFIKMN